MSVGNGPGREEETSVTPQPQAAPSQRRGGFFGRFIAALLVVVITTFLALLAVAALFFSLGFSVDTPQRLADIQTRLGTAEAHNSTLEFQNSALQTQVSELGRRTADEGETLDELIAEMAAFQGLREQFDSSVSQNATMVAEARASRDAVALFATAEADRVTLLQDLERRSLRIERFLQRLSDISADTALDLEAEPVASPVSGAEATPTDVATPEATSSPEATSTSEAEPSSTPTAARPTATSRASSTPTEAPATRTPIP